MTLGLSDEAWKNVATLFGASLLRLKIICQIDEGCCNTAVQWCHNAARLERRPNMARSSIEIQLCMFLTIQELYKCKYMLYTTRRYYLACSVN